VNGALRLVHPTQRIEPCLRFGVQLRAGSQALRGAFRFNFIDRLFPSQRAAEDDGDDRERGGCAEEDDEGVGRAGGVFGRHISC
jgi:hypothetical protein